MLTSVQTFTFHLAFRLLKALYFEWRNRTRLPSSQRKENGIEKISECDMNLQAVAITGRCYAYVPQRRFLWTFIFRT